MKIPIYAQLKSKLESKGLDSTTSGQIAWFVFSFFVSHLIFICWWLIANKINDIIDFMKYIYVPILAPYFSHFFSLFFMWCIFLLNCLYKINMIPLISAIVILWIYFYNVVISVCFFCAIVIVLFFMQKRLCLTFIIAVSYLALSFYIFDLRGGFYK
ncbi:hypothetical protein [Helicobacter sp. T3_23-1056]